MENAIISPPVQSHEISILSLAYLFLSDYTHLQHTLWKKTWGQNCDSPEKYALTGESKENFSKSKLLYITYQSVAKCNWKGYHIEPIKRFIYMQLITVMIIDCAYYVHSVAKGRRQRDVYKWKPKIFFKADKFQ